jgi:hypothetical protein
MRPSFLSRAVICASSASAQLANPVPRFGGCPPPPDSRHLVCSSQEDVSRPATRGVRTHDDRLEESAADEKLTEIAEGEVRPDTQGEDGEGEEEGAPKAKTKPERPTKH